MEYRNAGLEIRHWTTFGVKNWYDEIKDIVKIVKISGYLKIHLTSSTYLATDIHRLTNHLELERYYKIKILTELEYSFDHKSEAKCYAVITPKNDGGDE